MDVIFHYFLFSLKWLTVIRRSSRVRVSLVKSPGSFTFIDIRGNWTGSMSSVALELEPWSWGSWILFHPLFYTYLKDLYNTKYTRSSRGWINDISCFSLHFLRIKFPFSVLPNPVVIQESRWQHSQSSGAWLTCSARPTTAAPGSCWVMHWSVPERKNILTKYQFKY